tara:strand:+ start:535 stop:1221 length:687 start_codon:yes stop_codon:yes gene_type:complete
MKYTGWELHNFDQAHLYRSYQYSLIKNELKGNILEVGPGNCIYLSNYLKVAKNVTLVEPTKKYFKILSKKQKKNKKIIIKKNFKKLKKNYFDTILYLDVIEHIKKDKAEIINAYKLLKLNGTLIICVPAFQFLYSLYDKKIGHFRRYSRGDFKKLLHNCNIKNYKMRYFDFLGFCLIFLSNFLTKDNLNNFSTKIKFWNYLIPISALIDTLFMKYFFGKSLLIKIKKN